MRTSIETITPEIATEILENHNHRNRTLAESTVQTYATDMRNGRWITNHQGIAIDSDGELIDGQHRLWAVVFSGVTIKIMVTRDVPVESLVNGVILKSMDTIDGGRVRTTGQRLCLSHGLKNGNQVAAAIRGIVLMVYPAAGQRKLTTSASLAIHAIYGKDVDAILTGMAAKKKVSHITAPLALYHHGEPEKAQEIKRQISTLEGLSSPIRAYLRYLESSHTNTSTSAARSMRVLANCIHLFHQGNEIQKTNDGEHGTQFLIGMFPSHIAKLKQEVSLVPTKLRRGSK